MRLPIRRAERLKTGGDDGPVQLTKEGLEKLKRKLEQLEKQELPEAIEDVRRTAEFGDFSENAEYQEAKWRMRRLHGQIFGLKEKIKRATVIKPDASLIGTVQLGSTIVIEKDGSQQAFHIVGPDEADPGRGWISYLSPLGRTLISHRVGDEVNGYTIQSIR